LRSFVAVLSSLTLLGAACSSGSPTTDASPQAKETGQQSSVSPADTSDWPYEFVTTTVDGSTLDTGDYAGTDLVLWFWAPW